MPEFSHLRTDSDFPNVGGVNVYQYENKIDYGRFNIEQMELMLCDVPWDVGEAHVGNRTRSGIGNVVYFETAQARDAWFDAIPTAKPGEDPTGKCFRFSTKFKELHHEQIIDVPIPYNVAALFNYLVVKYQPFASEGDFVEYETGRGKLKWFWFVRSVEFVAPNTTRLHLLDDAFQTWIYDVNVSGMILERGHAPMFAMKAEKYLQNPIANNTGLLTEDVNYGHANQVTHIDALALNAGDMYACIATSANPKGSWGTKDASTWKVPTKPLSTNQGVPSYYVFAMDPDQLSTFLSTVSTEYPQFAQTVQAVFFAPKNMVRPADAFTFAGVSCVRITASRTTMNLTKLKKSDFAFPARYADIAKLYTYPYAHIEITDEHGNVDVIKVEDTSGTIDVSAALSLAYPYVNVAAHLLGVGGSASANITYRNVISATFDIKGTWYETLREWQVPTFAITLDPAREYDYSSYFDRAQAKLDYQTNYANTLETAKTEKDNVKKSTNAAKTNANQSADTVVDNTAIQVAGNTSITNTSNKAAAKDTYLSNELGKASYTNDSQYTYATTNNEVKAENASAAIGVGGSIANSTIQGLMSGGPIGGAVGLVSGAISGVTSMLNTAVSTNLKQEQADAVVSNSLKKLESTNTNNTDRTTNQNDTNQTNTETTNSAATGIAANNAATMKDNAKRTATAQNKMAQASYDTAISNAQREQTRAQTAIQNNIDQAALNAPSVYGAFANGASATTKPMALFSNVVTQSRSAITAAGDEFLRYGYMYDMQWEFSGNWNIGKYFTYWKLKDFWVRDLQVPDLYMDKLRFFLFGGVTIWRKPEYIGKVSIYDNFK